MRGEEIKEQLLLELEKEIEEAKKAQGGDGNAAKLTELEDRKILLERLELNLLYAEALNMVSGPGALGETKSQSSREISRESVLQELDRSVNESALRKEFTNSNPEALEQIFGKEVVGTRRAEILQTLEKLDLSIYAELPKTEDVAILIKREMGLVLD